jgi:hypothetical protein
MKRLILATGLFAAIACSSLHAQTMNMQVSIPFDFRVGTTVLPSGEYQIHHATNGVLFVADVQGKHAVSFVTIGGDHPKTPAAGGVLQFSRYGDDYYLAKLWTSDSGAARVLPQSKRETELAKRVGLTETASVSIQTK